MIKTKKKYLKINDLRKNIAVKIINNLFNIIENGIETDDKDKIILNNNFKKKYFKLIKQISMKFRIKLSKEQKKKFCKKCFNSLDSNNSITRLTKDNIKITCNYCKNTKKIALKKQYLKN